MLSRCLSQLDLRDVEQSQNLQKKNFDQNPKNGNDKKIHNNVKEKKLSEEVLVVKKGNLGKGKNGYRGNERKYVGYSYVKKTSHKEKLVEEKKIN